MRTQRAAHKAEKDGLKGDIAEKERRIAELQKTLEAKDTEHNKIRQNMIAETAEMKDKFLAMVREAKAEQKARQEEKTAEMAAEIK